ncbi:MAG: hypothetical protein L0241_21215, partial [Planctomycetia bacterium]|nr:hypothetical protein [Planctomycetia bacterium]
RLVAARKYELYYARFSRVPGVQPRVPTAIEVAAVMFAESQVHSKYIPRTIAITTLFNISGLQTAVQGGDDRAMALRAVLNAWFDSRTEPADMYSALSMANTLKMDAAGRLATRMIGMSGIPASYRGQALATLVRIGSKDHLPAIEKLIGDNSVMITLTTIVNGQPVQTHIQVGDTALAAAVLLTGQKLEDYGIEDRLKGNPGTFNYTRYMIPEDKRKEAVAKWKAWREKNP